FFILYSLFVIRYWFSFFVFLYRFHVIHPTKQGKSNPTSVWQTGKNAVCQVSFSPNARHVAIVSRDGFMRWVDIFSERYCHHGLRHFSLSFSITHTMHFLGI